MHVFGVTQKEHCCRMMGKPKVIAACFFSGVVSQPHFVCKRVSLHGRERERVCVRVFHSVKAGFAPIMEHASYAF